LGTAASRTTTTSPSATSTPLSFPLHLAGSRPPQDERPASSSKGASSKPNPSKKGSSKLFPAVSNSRPRRPSPTVGKDGSSGSSLSALSESSATKCPNRLVAAPVVVLIFRPGPLVVRKPQSSTPNRSRSVNPVNRTRRILPPPIGPEGSPLAEDQSRTPDPLAQNPTKRRVEYPYASATRYNLMNPQVWQDADAVPSKGPPEMGWISILEMQTRIA
jgi:hypothetical protein